MADGGKSHMPWGLAGGWEVAVAGGGHSHAMGGSGGRLGSGWQASHVCCRGVGWNGGKQWQLVVESHVPWQVGQGRGDL